VGGDFFERIGAARADRAAPAGLVDRLSDLGAAGLDVERIAPAVRLFFLDPGALRLRIASRWHGAFALVWALVRPLMRRVGQLALPRDRAEVVTRLVALDPERDGRADARGVVRAYADGEVMQVIAYATHRAADGAGFMSAALPVPLGALCGLLRLELLVADGGARLTSRRASGARSGDPVGIWFAPLRGPAVRVPLEETIELWPARAPGAPAELRAAAGPDDVIVGRHVQRLAGLRFATHAYW
jgi:hypothetical protein